MAPAHPPPSTDDRPGVGMDGKLGRPSGLPPFAIAGAGGKAEDRGAEKKSGEQRGPTARQHDRSPAGSETRAAPLHRGWGFRAPRWRWAPGPSGTARGLARRRRAAGDGAAGEGVLNRPESEDRNGGCRLDQPRNGLALRHLPRAGAGNISMGRQCERHPRRGQASPSRGFLACSTSRCCGDLDQPFEGMGRPLKFGGPGEPMGAAPDHEGLDLVRSRR